MALQVIVEAEARRRDLTRRAEVWSRLCKHPANSFGRRGSGLGMWRNCGSGEMKKDRHEGPRGQPF
jgi:hypothetical protein